MRRIKRENAFASSNKTERLRRMWLVGYGLEGERRSPQANAFASGIRLKPGVEANRRIKTDEQVPVPVLGWVLPAEGGAASHPPPLSRAVQGSSEETRPAFYVTRNPSIQYGCGYE